MNKGNITIHKKTVTKQDLSFCEDDMVLVRFMNNGQHYVRLDDQIIIGPGEAYVEGDISGPGIEHSYQITFATNSTPPTANPPIVYSGNRCEVRILKRKKNHA